MDKKLLMETLSVSFIIVSIFCKSAISIETSLRKILLQSSNNESFVYKYKSSPSSDPDVDTNETWTATGFRTPNLTLLLSEHPHFVHSLPPKNSSRFFFVKNSSASLTILVKSFKDGMLFLNFSYFIGKTIETETLSRLTNNATVSVTTDKGIVDLPIMMERTAAKPSLVQSDNNLSQRPKAVNVPQTVVLESNEPSMPISIPSSPPENSKVLESVLLKPEIRRNRRSTHFESMPSASPLTSSVLGNDLENETTINELSTGRTVTPNYNEITSNSPHLQVSDNLTDSLSLVVQAVEMFKTAAAAISKGAKAVASSAADQVHSSVSGSSIQNEDASSITTTSTEHHVASSNDLQPVTEMNEQRSTTTEMASKWIANENINTSDIGIEETTTEIVESRIRKRNHHKSKSSNGKSSKSESRKRKNRGKKLDNVERNEKDADSDEKNDGNDNSRRSSSSSSSSSSEEKLDVDASGVEETIDRKPKISYKMWRASLEKKNRPPGLFLTVNDDIIFDNWEGIWDKNFVLGKWTGAKALADGNWNRTNLLLNFDPVEVGREIKITFEWEPIDDDHELILSDIEISTIKSSQPECTTEMQNDQRSIVKENPESSGEKSAVMPAVAGLPDAPKSIDSIPTKPNETDPDDSDDDSIIVLKQRKSGVEGWEIVKIGKTDSSATNNHEYGKSANEKRDGNTEEILRTILENLHNNLHVNAMQPIETETASSPMAFTQNTNPPIYTVKPTNDTPGGIENVVTGPVVQSPSLPASVVDTKTANGNQSPVSPTDQSTSTTQPLIISATSATPILPTTLPPAAAPIIAPVTKPTKTATIFVLETLSSPTSSPVEKVKPVVRAFPPRKTDKETALFVSVLTGILAFIILVMIIKRRIDLSSKGRNATR